MNTSISPQSSSIMAANLQSPPFNTRSDNQVELSGNGNSSIFVQQPGSTNFDACEEPSPRTGNEVEISLRDSSYKDHLPNGWMAALSVLAVVTVVAVAVAVPAGAVAISALSSSANLFPLISAQGNLYAITKHHIEEHETAESFGSAPWTDPLYTGHELIQEQHQDHMEQLFE